MKFEELEALHEKKYKANTMTVGEAHAEDAVNAQLVDDDDDLDYEDELEADLTTALELLNKCLNIMEQIIIQPSTGHIKKAPRDLAIVCEEVTDFIEQWTTQQTPEDEQKAIGKAFERQSEAEIKQAMRSAFRD